MADASEIPKTMRAVLVEETGGPEVLQYRTDLPVPEPDQGEILVRNDYAGINFIDTYFRTGLYSASLPEILGLEGEGVVAAVGTGETYSLQRGDRVVWTSTGVVGGSGGYAEYTTTAASRAIKIPSSIPTTHAVAALVQGLTALTLVREAHAVQKDDWVLVHAAAGGCGLWLCQILRHLGARTIGTASSEAKLALARDHGAGWTINYSTEDWVERVKEITEGKGVIAVFDGVGQATFDSDLDVLARKGSLVSFGNASGDVPPFSIRRLAAKNLKLVRPRFPAYIETRSEFEGYMNELFQFMIEDKMRVQIHQVYHLADVKQAHQDLESRNTTGKLLLKL